jgi:hypothetical protein
MGKYLLNFNYYNLYKYFFVKKIFENKEMNVNSESTYFLLPVIKIILFIKKSSK